MAIQITCEKCSKSMSAPDEAAGKIGKCPNCQAAVEIPPQAKADTAPASGEPAPKRLPKLLVSIPSGRIPGLVITDGTYEVTPARGRLEIEVNASMPRSLILLIVAGVIVVLTVIVSGIALMGDPDDYDSFSVRLPVYIAAVIALAVYLPLAIWLYKNRLMVSKTFRLAPDTLGSVTSYQTTGSVKLYKFDLREGTFLSLKPEDDSAFLQACRSVGLEPKES